MSREPAALTSSEGSLLIVNPAYRERFGGSRPPLELGSDEQATQGLQLARSMAWRDGAGCVAALPTIAGHAPVEVERVGAQSDLLLWRVSGPRPVDAGTPAGKNIQRPAGDPLSAGGVVGAGVGGQGTPPPAER